MLKLGADLKDRAYVGAFCFEKSKKKKEVEYAERRGRTAGSGTAASLINTASGNVQLLLWGSTLRTAVSQ